MYSKAETPLFYSAEENRVKSLKGSHRLPIKSNNKLVKNDELIRDILINQHSLNEEKPKNIQKVKKKGEIKAAPSLPELFHQRQVKLKKKERKLAVLALKIIENPEENIIKLKQLVLFLKDGDPFLKHTIFRTAALTLCELFCDIIPGYKIRPLNEGEKNTKLKKETRKLKDYEESLLRYYKHYINNLKTKLEYLQKYEVNEDAEIAKQKLGKIALECICKHIISHPHFNFTPELIKLIIPFGIHLKDSLRNLVIKTLSDLFKNDKLGAISLVAADESITLIKSNNYKVPPDFLNIFLSLNIKEVDFEQKGRDVKTMREEFQKLSRKERKWQKKIRPYENELREAEAKENKESILKNHTKIIKKLFHLYFWILKNNNVLLLTSVLEGLSKFAHLINVDFMDDMVAVLGHLLQNQELSPRENLYCLNTIFTILSEQGKALTIDPCKFYINFYNILLEVPLLEHDDLKLTFILFDRMFCQRRRSLSRVRVLATIKRMAMVSLEACTLKPPVAGALLAAIRVLFINHPHAEHLLDTEAAMIDLYDPELPDPEYSRADTTSIISELTCLQSHSVPYINKMATAFLKQTINKLSSELCKPPLEVYLHLLNSCTLFN